ncbi:MAG: radical SAM family heme chaperone HemW [Verrucomicrobia bacterium]|nr:radical SAM family heme chaperone HemW [Verrucomicrobiota bacterium]NBU10109.1 radical SAM family heme chaperone HemW [Pseudomonadota bacterium]NDA66004.1 radical SAM family heme chaperone HemW [Verrucomicrobiota bacterium]NDD38472.1 radical SAM family heme chaperone HemW [Verrucomicrobiota bacterium]NDE97635.1 radical SAM family heme chaperone HemW [Verrucomicrobiota bacterium]
MMRSSGALISSLYLHVPFCAHKCEYCAFYSAVPKEDLVGRYVNALVRELELVAHELKPRTVFFGGGTPSLLNLKQWEQILKAFERLGLLGAEEWTVECNPATVSADKAKLLRDFGVNRISMGVQSLDERLLERLGRIHSRAQVFKSFDTLRAAGFANINLDLMFAIPTQTMEHWRVTLHDAIALGSEHLSCYEVIYEDDTPLFEQLKAGEFDVDEELTEAMYEELVNLAGQAGLGQYEVANFARSESSIQNSAFRIPSRACLHNVNYWRGGQFHALGPSAAGYVRGVRTKNWSNTQLYCEQLEKGVRAIEQREELPPLARAGEIAAFGLRMNVGWGFEEFRAVTSFDLHEHWRADMDTLIAEGFATRTADRFYLTPRGLRFADHAAEKFLRPGTR